VETPSAILESQKKKILRILEVKKNLGNPEAEESQKKKNLGISEGEKSQKSWNNRNLGNLKTAGISES
jgi:hypothetical protein